MRSPAKNGSLLGDLGRDPVMWSWALFVFFFPFYVFPSGLPQPADILVLLISPRLVKSWDGRLSSGAKRALLALMGFTIYVTLSNVLWTLWTAEFAFNPKDGFLLSPAFYIYDAILFFIALLIYRQRGDAFINITVRAVLISVIVQVPMTIFFGRATALRSSGMFNAPNQLGYFAVLSACIVLLGHRRAKLSTMSLVAGMLACSYLALLSASKAALASTALLILFSVVTRLKTMIIATAVAAVLLLTVDPVGEAVDRTVRRISNDDSFGFVEERGYDRIGKYPEYWIFGSGEGDYTRFAENSMIKSHELHSSAGTIFFCYGVVGSLIFLIFLFQIVRVAQFRQILLVLPAAAYGLSHQGLRVTLFWVFLVLALILGEEARNIGRRVVTRTRSVAPARIA